MTGEAMKRVAVIGGGASGMAAALEAAKRGFSVTVFEKKEQLGKKLSATGNGHCNFTNAAMEPAFYRSRELPFIERFLRACPTERVLGFFRELGLLFTERDGYYYPASNQAASVLSVLSERLKSLCVTLKTNTDVTGLIPEEKGFTLLYGRERERFDACVLALGSRSGVSDPNPFRGYEILKSLGHRVYEPLPSLVPLHGRTGFEKDWAGVRTKASVSFRGQRESGELQLTAEGISGIPVFQLSHGAVAEIREKGLAEITVDFLPDYPEEELTAALKGSGNGEPFGREKLETYLRGWLPRKLILPLLKASGIHAPRGVGELTEEERNRLIRTIKSFSYPADGFGDMRDSQVTNGGLDLREVRDSFESKKCPGLFITGELLDADGLCGGYNLHFAFGSGLIAGQSILSGEKE